MFSDDGKPLAVSIPDLFHKFPYDRLPSNGDNEHDYCNITSLFLRPEIMLLLIVLYVCHIPLLSALVRVTGFDGKRSKTLKWIVVLHNLALASFSAIVFVVVATKVLPSHLSRGFVDVIYCDKDGSFWNDGNGIGIWAFVFYISKYYEFLDTSILILKGKDPSFLQTYHHVGIACTMWGAIVSQSAWVHIVVVLNSFIHTLMYLYFLIKTIRPSMEIKAAKYLTSAQVLQFIIGIVYTFGVLVSNKCDTDASRFVLAVIDIYAIGLILLFLMFAKRKYKKT